MLVSHNFDDGSIDPFTVCTTQNPNFVRAEDGRMITWWTEVGYNGTRMDKGAEACADQIVFNKEGWYGMNVELGADYPTHTSGAIAQIFGFKTDFWSWSGLLEMIEGDLVAIHRRGGGGHTEAIVYENFPNEEEFAIIVHYILSDQNNGVFQVWVDGELLYDAQNINFGMGDFTADDIQDVANGNYTVHKIGQYNHTDTEYITDETRTVYYDNVSWYNGGAEGFDIVNPSVNTQQTVEIDLTEQYQTIQGFGASDAWNFDPVGKHWNTDVKEDIAEKLFSTEINGNNPNGIGLSRWRFNIGAGSAEQGDDSKIEHEERRSECFITSVEDVNGEEVVTYDWNKQAGQQWFLQKANEYNVHQLVAFLNSPPRFYTKNGRTNSDNTDRFGNTNLGDSNYNRFSDFMTDVLEHFSDEGIEFSQISPINEPQYKWSSGQEGCPYTHEEVYKLVEKLNRDIVDRGLDTKILLSEAGDYRYLTGIKDHSLKSDIIDNYFDPNSTYYMGNFSQMLPGIGAHSYWINGSDESISSNRHNLRNKLDEYNDLEVYQTEYNLLNTHHDDKLLNSIFLAKIIYTDLEIVGASIWDYWTAIERERWSQKNRFFLLRLIPGGGNYASLENTGRIEVDKNLWALGNFSRFIRPGYKRVKTTGANNLDGLMGVSFIAPDDSEIVTVYVNWSDSESAVKHNLKGIPSNTIAGDASVFITDVNNDLTRQADHNLDNAYIVPAQSIVTLRIPLTNLCENTSNNEFIEAEDYCKMSGIDTEPCNEGGLNIGFIHTNDWTMYANVDLTNQKSVKARFATRNAGGTIEFRIDCIDGALLGTIGVSVTGDWQNWQSDSININEVSGEHDVYLVFKGGNSYLYNVNWFGFSEEPIIITNLDAPNEYNSEVYPNPTLGIVKLNTIDSYQVINPLGQIILSGKGKQIDLSEQAKGLYTLRIGQQTFKVIKK